MILLIDNYDSFSYNLYHLVGRQNPMIRVVRNDAVTVEEIKEMGPQALLLSPGPGKPNGAGICIEAVQRLHHCFCLIFTFCKLHLRHAVCHNACT